MADKIDATIQDSSGRFKENIKGEIKDNVFVYKENSLFGYGGEEKKANYSDKGLIEVGKGKNIIIYKRVGNDLIQIIPDADFSGKSIKDIISSVETAVLKKDAMLTQPASLKKLLEFLTIVLIIIAVIGIFVIGNNTSHNIQTDLQPVNKSVQLQGQEIQFQTNITKEMLRVCNESIAYIARSNPSINVGGATNQLNTLG